MQKFALLISLALFSFLQTLPNSALMAQCPTVAIVLTTQAEVDNFAITYPGCSTLTAALRTEGSGITNLNGLSVITSTTSSIQIFNTSLTNLNGLNNLTSAGIIQINFNLSLTDISALSNLSSSSSGIGIVGNNALTSLNGLQNLTLISTSDLSIASNASLSDISALSNISSSIRSLQVINNGILTNLDGLCNITDVNHILRISNNGSLSDCCCLQSSIGSFSGSVTVQGNATGCANVSEVGSSAACGQVSSVVPTLSEWGLILLTLMMISMGLVVIWKHQRKINRIKMNLKA